MTTATPTNRTTTETNDNDDTSADNLDDDVTDDDAHPSDHGFYQFAPRPSDEIGVFVAKTGDDANPGTMAEPKKTIGAGVALAEAAGKSVFVAVGTYEESVNSKVSLYGGFNNAFSRREIDLLETVIAATEDFGAKFDLPDSDAYVVLEGFTIRESETQYQAGYDTTTGVAVSGGHIVLSRNIIYGGAGESTFGVDTDVATPVIVRNKVYGTAFREERNRSTQSWAVAVGGSEDWYLCCLSALLIGNVIDAGVTADRDHSLAVGLSVGFGASAVAFNNVISGGEARGYGSRSLVLTVWWSKAAFGYSFSHQ
ncbi:MAG: DUF1565 domain-containing protein [Deltaproteobacteria bacterium]|nr:DUF1565 domain-containing protein [Deltaproteobacteria bacterium]